MSDKRFSKDKDMNFLLRLALLVFSVCAIASCGSNELNSGNEEPGGEVSSSDSKVALNDSELLWKKVFVHSKTGGGYPFGVQVIESQKAFEVFLEEIEYEDPLPQIDFLDSVVIAFAKHHGSGCQPTFKDLQIDGSEGTIEAVYEGSPKDVCPEDVVGHVTVVTVAKTLVDRSYEVLSPVSYHASATYQP